MWPPFCLTTSCKRNPAFATTFRHRSSESARHNFTLWALSCATFFGLFWPPKARKCSAAQGPHSEVVPRAFWRIVSKSCDECKGSFARGYEAKRWSHLKCSSLGTIFQPMRINSVPDVKCFCNNKNVFMHNQWYDISCATCIMGYFLLPKKMEHFWNSEVLRCGSFVLKMVFVYAFNRIFLGSVFRSSNVLN